MSYTYKYPRPAVTADVVAITKEEASSHTRDTGHSPVVSWK